MAKSTRTHYLVVAYRPEGVATFKITPKIARPIVKPLGYYAAAKCDYEVLTGASMAYAYRVKLSKYTGKEVSVEIVYVSNFRFGDQVRKECYGL